MRKICFCTGITDEKLEKIIKPDSSLNSIIKKTKATTFCGACYEELKQFFYLIRFKKRNPDTQYLLF